MSIKKVYVKKKPICKVTFNLSVSVGEKVRNAAVLGEFNNWSASATPMKRLRNGEFTASVELARGRNYQFRYLLDKTQWENDPEADRLVPTPYGDCYNSVLEII